VWVAAERGFAAGCVVWPGECQRRAGAVVASGEALRANKSLSVLRAGWQ